VEESVEGAEGPSDMKVVKTKPRTPRFVLKILCLISKLDSLLIYNIHVMYLNNI